MRHERRTCAKLCHTSGGEIEQIQFLLGHASVQTTERYLGCKQNLGHPVNDLFRLGNITVATQVSFCRETEARPRTPMAGNPLKCQSMKAVAIKKGQTRERAPAFEEMGTLRCDRCGEEFIVFQDSIDQKAAERQAHWLEKVLAEEHERERKHPDRIQLPD